ncbi:MAG: site-specific integrase [Desulfosalsimonadaceae bacterium]
MAVQWFKTKHKGLRYRKHPKRKHGIEFDRFYQYRHTKPDGGRVEESLGWLSEGWSEDRCLLEIVNLKQAKTTGEGPLTLAEKREIAERKRAVEAEKKAKAERDKLTFLDVWPKYLDLAKTTKKSHTIYQEVSGMQKWVFPVIGKKPLADICTLDLERVKKNILDAGRAPRTAQYTLAMIRQVLNFAIEHGFLKGENPSRKVKKMKFDNKRLRFLTVEETETLLDALKKHSLELHDAALMSLHTAARAGEIFGLELRDLDFETAKITLRDTKNTETRIVYMSDTIKQMLETRRAAIMQRQQENKDWNPQGLVFPGRNGKPITSVSRTFDRVVETLPFNEGITDRRQKFTFHNLRHTAASWLVQHGTPLFTVQQLLGHKSPQLTARYSHLTPGNLQDTAKFFDQMKTTTGAEIIPMTGAKQS